MVHSPIPMSAGTPPTSRYRSRFLRLFSGVTFALIVALVLSGCKKSGSSSGGGNISVYVAGFDNGNMVYWQNRKENVLSTAGYVGNTTGLAVAGGDVYVSGYVYDTAVYWKNGTEIYLSIPDTSIAAATSIAISGTDIYVAGYGQINSGNYYAGIGVVYWKNGVRTVLSTTSNTVNSVSIAISGSDVYVAATYGNYTAGYWKDGTFTALGSANCYALGIAVSGGDVYVVGSDDGVPVYWKNGTETALPYTANSGASGIAISGSDVYISGVDNGNAVYWKNGTEETLDAGAANAIAVSGSDVYVTGYRYASQINYAVYWKNGSLVSFVGSQPGTQETEEGNAIVIAQ